METRGRGAIPKYLDVDCGDSSACMRASNLHLADGAAWPCRACVILISYNQIRKKIKIDGLTFKGNQFIFGIPSFNPFTSPT